MATRDLTKAEQNFTCFAKACVEYTKLPLIDILDKHVKPVDLSTKLNSATLASIKSKLRPDQLKLCFPQPPLLPDYNTFDVSLLYTLIRNICPFLRPTRGWGVEPNATDTNIGDDIERLRLFRNNFYAHASSTEIPDGEFKNLWTNLKSVMKRLTISTKAWNTANYEEELQKLENLRFGYSDRDHFKLILEATLNVSKHSEERDEPEILIKGPCKVLCGDTACYEAEVKQTTSSHWSVKWQKKTGDITKDINSSDRKYKGSTNKQLVIMSVRKDDEGEYQAVLTNGKNVIVISNTIYLLPVGEYPVFNMWEIRTDLDKIIIHYGYTQCTPEVFDFKWTKDGKTLDWKNKDLYKGGSLNEYYLNITSPTLDDKGNYSCTVTNAVGSVSKDVTLDLPIASIFADSGLVHSYCGSKTIFQPKVISCPPSHRVEWQSSSDGHSFLPINISKPHYYGSSQNPESPLLVIPKTTLNDMLHYRLLVWNYIGYQYSNTLYLRVTGSPPNIMTSHETFFEEHSIKLIGKVFLKDQFPAAQNVFWTKDGEKLDTSEKKNKYSDVTKTDPSLTIYNVNEHDAGSYQLTASNAVGSTESDVIVLDIPRIHIKSKENSDGSQCFTAHIESIPAAYQAEWKMKRNNDDLFIPVDVNAVEFRGTLNTLPRPVLVIKRKKQLEKYNFNIEVDNFVGSCIKDIPGTVNPERIETASKTSGVIKKENIPNSKKSPFNFIKRKKSGKKDNSSPPGKQEAEQNKESLSRSFIGKKGVDLIKPMVHGGNSERRFIYEGSVEFAQGLRTQDRYLFLFNDLLLVAKEKYSKTFTLKHRIRVCEIWLATCIYDVSCTMPPPDNSFVLGWPVTNVVATFRTVELKELWLNKLNEAIELERIKEVNKSVSVKVNCHDQTCTLQIDNNTTARDLLTLCIGRFHIPESEVNAYHLWVKTGKGKPYLLKGHEFPRSIKLSQLRNAAKTDDPMVDFDGKDHEYKRKSLKFILRKRVKESTKPSMNDGIKVKKAKKKKTFFNFFKSLMIDKKSNSAPTGKLFGHPLSDVMNDGQLPKAVMKLMTLVIIKGPYTEGVFRKSCNMKLANEIYKKLDKGQDCLDENTPTLVVAHLLKEFLKSLPHCLLHEEFYEDWVSLSEEENSLQKLEKVKGLLNILPEGHKKLLKHLLCVLYHIDRNHEENTMTSYNLSLCIAPTILWAKKVDGSSMAIAVDRSSQQIVEYLIKNCIKLFGGDIIHLFEDLLEPLACSVYSSESVTNMYDDTSIDTLSGIMYNSSGYPSVSSFNKSSIFCKSRSGDHLYFDNEPIKKLQWFNTFVRGNMSEPPLRRNTYSFADSTSLASQLEQYQSSNNSLATNHTFLDQSWHNYSETKDYNDQCSTADTRFKNSFQSFRDFKDDLSNNAAHSYSIEDSPNMMYVSLPSKNKSKSNGIGYHFYSSQTEINPKHHTPISPFHTFYPFKPARYEKWVSDLSSNSSEHFSQYAPPTSFPKYPFQHQGFVQTPVHDTHVNSIYRTENDNGCDIIHKYGSGDTFASRPENPPCYDEALSRKTKFETDLQLVNSTSQEIKREEEIMQHFNETTTKLMYEYEMQSPYKHNEFVGSTSECGSKQNDDNLEPYKENIYKESIKLFKKYRLMREHKGQ